MSHANQLLHQDYPNEYIKIINSNLFFSKVIREVNREVQQRALLLEKEIIEQLLKAELTQYPRRNFYQHIRGEKEPECYRSGYYPGTFRS